MANTSLFVAAILLGVVVSLAAADSGTATYYTTYVRTYTHIHALHHLNLANICSNIQTHMITYVSTS